MYCICWFPIKMYQFLLNFEIISYCSERQFYLMLYVYLSSHWLAMTNSFVNPIIYSFMTKSFRVSLNKKNIIIQLNSEIIGKRMVSKFTKKKSKKHALKVWGSLIAFLKNRSIKPSPLSTRAFLTTPVSTLYINNLYLTLFRLL